MQAHLLNTTMKGHPEMLSFWFLVLVFGSVGGSLEPHPGDAEGRDLLHCRSRLDRIERFLQQQDDKLSYQENLIRHLNEAGTRQNDLSRLQEDRLSRQENLIRQLQQRDVNRENLLSEFRKLQPQRRGREKDNRYETDIAHGPPKVGAHQREGTPTARDAATRSDDMGPMEAVVAQLSQKMTEVQALQTQSSADIQMLKAGNSQQDLDIRDARSSAFVQWGSSACGSNSTLIYSGVVGGSNFQHSGAAVNYLCLTLSPVLLAGSGAGAFLHGAEYETSDSHEDKDPVCAVCRSTFAATIMIPGTNVCTPGWHKQYSGYLMAGGYSHTAASEYICVDSKLENFVGSNDDRNGKLLYYVRTRCGSLPCTPYANDRVVTCTVCSK